MLPQKPLYSIQPDFAAKEPTIIIQQGGYFCYQLKGGQAQAITITHANLLRQDAQRADDYLFGVMSGLLHCVLTGAIPAVALAPDELRKGV